MGNVDLTYSDFVLILNALDNLKYQTISFLEDARMIKASNSEILMAKTLQNDCDVLIKKMKKSSEG